MPRNQVVVVLALVEDGAVLEEAEGVAVLLLVMDIAEVGLFVVPGVVVGETTRADMEVVVQVKNDTEAHTNVIYHHVIMADASSRRSTIEADLNVIT